MSESIFPEAIRPESYVPLRLQVYSALRDAIIQGRLKAGERIVEDRVCSELGVSRSPLREALRRLEGDGLVAIVPRQGAVVAELTDQDGMELFAVREVLEGLAAKLAAKHITAGELAQLESLCNRMEQSIQARQMSTVVELHSQLHELITEASRNRWIREFVTSVRTHIRRIYRSSIENPERAQRSLAEHRLILEALRQGDSRRAERLAREHVQHARKAALVTGPIHPLP